jgi:pre-mRNA-processing factor 19
MFFCALSGEAPQDPVVSAKSGHVYERRLINKYIAENGTDPITGEQLAETDLIAVKASPSTVPPRPPNLTSIPALLHALQNEWDSLVLEAFTLRQQYNATRQELSHALYQHDAATRVVARLLKERDAAREALTSVQTTMGITPTPATNDVEMADTQESTGVLPADVNNQIEETQRALSSVRKKRKSSPNYVNADEVRTFTSKDTIGSLHSAKTSGIASIAVSQTNPSHFLTGGNDHIVQLYDRSSNKVLAALKGHTKKVGVLAWREKEGENNLILSGSTDKTARIWAHDSGSGEYAPQMTIKVHKGEITGLAVHPTSTLVALASLDKTYSIHSLTTSQSLFQSTAGETAFSSLAIHPDGALLGIGTPSSTLHVYDIRAGTIAASLTPEEVAQPFTVNTLSFSENGYHLAAPDSASSVAIWDLRKLKPVRSIDLQSAKIHSVRYDTSAQFLAVAGSDVRVFQNKTWDELVRLESEAVDVNFGMEGKELWTAAGREVKIWGIGSG